MKKLIDLARAHPADVLLLSLALAKLLLHLFTASGYGYFRDEFYYLAASRNLAFGYVDFPPFIALLTALVRNTLGDSLLALHFFPALAGAALVYLTGLMARQLGANRFGQGLAALAVLIAPQFLGAFSLLTMDPFDVLAWSVAIYILILIFKYDRPKYWLWFGLAVGIGLTIKIGLLYFGPALVIGMLLSPQRRQFRNPDLYTGGAIALAGLLPYIWWNAANGWPTLEFFSGYADKVYQASPLEFLLQQVLIMHPATLPLWITGLVFLFRERQGTYRPLGWAYVILLVIFMLQHAKNYFLAPMYPVLFAAGALHYQPADESRPFFSFKSSYVWTMLVFGILVLPLTVPILPVNWTAAITKALGGGAVRTENNQTGSLPQHFADRFGWREMAAAVSEAYHSLPEDEQAEACIFTGNYGEAGALEFYSEKYDLPRVVSGHNNYFLWGSRGCSGKVVILVNAGGPAELEQVFDDVQHAGWIRCEYCMPYENNLPIYTGRGLAQPLEQFWPAVKNFE